ncbi:hypothetical protein LY13_004268 [Prauserella aidingensis]|nr:hypothetical protein [Prauserella aidingensis]
MGAWPGHSLTVPG